MSFRRRSRNERGAVLVLVLVLTMTFGFLAASFLTQSQVQARATRFRAGSMRALYQAYGELEKAKRVIGESAYNAQGKNLAIQAALAAVDRKIAGTDVVISPMTGVDGTWYDMTVTVPFENAERVVSQAVREIDFFSSYNLFVAEDPAGISGSPVGAVHTNEGLQLYFPNGDYRHSLTAVGGQTYRAGADAANTSITGPFNPNANRIEIDYAGSDRFNLNYIESNAETGFAFDGTNNLRLYLYGIGNEQWARLEEWSKPRVDVVIDTIFMGFSFSNPHEETFHYTERVQVGTEPRTRSVSVLDHTDTVMDPVLVPRYRSEIQTRSVPVLRDETRTRTVMVRTWIPLTGATGGTAVGGESGALGYYADLPVTENYTVQVLDHMGTESYTASVFDHYDTVMTPRIVPVYRTETETYDHPLYEDQPRSITYTAYDSTPIYESRPRDVYVPGARVSSQEVRFPENGLLFTDGNIDAIQGDIVDRITVAARGSIMVTGDLQYKDEAGHTSYLNGKAPWLDYVPNPDYHHRSTLGVIAQGDVLLSRNVPDNMELNASLLSISGRVGIEGIVLDAAGEVNLFNQLKDQWGRPVAGTFRKNSIRRLGGITTALRPVETVVRSNAIESGFNVGQAVFDVGLLEGPPPYFLPFPIPRFFATLIQK